MAHREDARGRGARLLVLPIEGCDGRGFGFDILPVDPNYRDERGGWFSDDDGEDDDEMAIDDSAPESSTNGEPDDEGDEKLPW